MVPPLMKASEKEMTHRAPQALQLLQKATAEQPGNQPEVTDEGASCSHGRMVILVRTRSGRRAQEGTRANTPMGSARKDAFLLHRPCLLLLFWNAPLFAI